MKTIFISILQLVVCIAAAPLVSGFITKIKNNLRLRKGQSVLQPYYNLAKLFSKTEVVSGTASWVFRSAPFVVMASSLTAAILVPPVIFYAHGVSMGGLVAFIFILALGRFFLALSALDTASAFGGMGSSREMFISALAEPALLLVLFSMAVRCGSTGIDAIGGAYPATVSSIVAAAALLMVTIAETSRVPVDNQETHLELTMVHEAMVLEYSGASLAMLELAAYIKQMIFFCLIAQIIFPVAMPVYTAAAQISLWFLWYLVRIAIVAIVIAVIEILVAKMRLFRVVDFLVFSFVLGIVAALCAIVGV